MEKIVLTSESARDLVFEDYLVIDGEEVPIKEVEDVYESSGRHQEYHSKVFEVLSTGKFYRIGYSVSVKDSMGWDECNYGPFEAVEVHPEQVTKTVYK